MAQQVRDEIPTPDNSTNFNVAAGSETPVGTTLENLKAAVGGETGASAHYSVYADAAEKAGYSQLAALWRATSAAEQIHIAMEYNAVTAEDPDWPRPEVTAGTDAPADLNLISSAQGEIYETSDMYPAFIKKAQEEGNTKAVQVFTLKTICGHTTTSIRPPMSTSISAPFAVISTAAKTSRSARSASLLQRSSSSTNRYKSRKRLQVCAD